MLHLQPPFSDRLTGTIVTLGGQTAATLIVRYRKGKLPGRRLYRGPLSIYYGFSLLYERDVILPLLIIDDFRQEYLGIKAIDFLLSKGNSYPRADVIGIRCSTGRQEGLFCKEVDVAAGLVAFAQPEGVEMTGLTKLIYAIWLDDRATVGDGLIYDDEAAPALMRVSTRCFKLHPDLLPSVSVLLMRRSLTR